MAIFGRNSARQKLRRASRESLNVSLFSPPVDCTPWVTGGIWPAELSVITADNAALVGHLKADLQRVVMSANADIARIRRAGLTASERAAEEARLIDNARSFAVQRVESTMRHFRPTRPRLPLKLRTQDFMDDASTVLSKLAVPDTTAERPVDTGDTDVLEGMVAPLKGIAPLAEPTVVGPPDPPNSDRAKPGEMQAVDAGDFRYSGHREPTPEQLKQLLGFVARQEPALSWAAGIRWDGSALLVTDIAHGWIPPGISLPAGVRLLEPGARSGCSALGLLGPTTFSVGYEPGDVLSDGAEYEDSCTAGNPRELPLIGDLGWLLSEATQWRDGLPQVVHALAKVAAAGTGVLASELESLQAYLAVSRRQVVMQYPRADANALLNCMLLAATERLAAGSAAGANYHYAWFRKLRDK